MPQLFPIQARVCKDNKLLRDVIAPPYDVVTRSEVKQYTQNNPRHFLNVTRPEGLMDEKIPFDDARVYQAARDHWEDFLKQGIFTRDDAPHFYIYAMDDGNYKQWGLVALISVQDYEKGVVRRHELTRPDKETDRVNHILAVNGQLSPVLLAVKDEGAIDTALKACAQGEPRLSAALNGVQHELWTVPACAEKTLLDLFAAHDLFYVADGHHRTAAALRVYQETGEHHFCFAVIFPSQHMKILGYHRTVKDLNGLNEADFLHALSESYVVKTLPEFVLPTRHGTCHMLLGKQAYALTRRDLDETDPVRALDVDALSRFVLTPILGIQDIRTDKRIGFVGGLNAVAEIQHQVESGQAAVGFAMYPTQTDELLRVAGANLLMPPKSTWFEPKLADGMICYSF